MQIKESEMLSSSKQNSCSCSIEHLQNSSGTIKDEVVKFRMSNELEMVRAFGGSLVLDDSASKESLKSSASVEYSIEVEMFRYLHLSEDETFRRWYDELSEKESFATLEEATAFSDTWLGDHFGVVIIKSRRAR